VDAGGDEAGLTAAEVDECQVGGKFCANAKLAINGVGSIEEITQRIKTVFDTL
jgi:hypothetical protein